MAGDGGEHGVEVDNVDAEGLEVVDALGDTAQVAAVDFVAPLAVAPVGAGSLIFLTGQELFLIGPLKI